MRVLYHSIAAAALVFGGWTAAYAGTRSQISLVAKDIIYDPFSQRIYASVPGTGGPLANRVAAIDPVTATITNSVFVGSEPGRLALSDNGQYLYVALDGAAAVRRVDLHSFTAGLQFPLGNEPFLGLLIAEDLAVMPGDANAVAISRRFSSSSSYAGVAVYDSGVQRPTTTPNFTGSRLIEFSADGSMLYGDDASSDAGLRRMSVTASGVSEIDVTSSLLGGITTDIAIAAGVIYVTNGRVVDAAAHMLLGTFAGPPSGPVVPDAPLQRSFFIQNNVLRVFSNTTFAPLGTASVPGLAGTPVRFVRWGTDGLAFNTNAGVIDIIRTSLVTCAPSNCNDSIPPPPSHRYDFDGDGRADVAVGFGTSSWTIWNAVTGNLINLACGGCAGVAVPGDYDGDGVLDFATYQPTAGEWSIRRSSSNLTVRTTWGCPSCGDVPVPADFDGDRKTDIAVYRRATGDWFVLQSSSSTLLNVKWGCGECGDIPVPADYDGDERADVAVYRLSTGDWFAFLSSEHRVLHQGWGCGSCHDVPVPADYDGDGKSDLAVYRLSSGDWFIVGSLGSLRHVSWGSPSNGDIPVPADYDGDRQTDIGVFRTTTNVWYIARSSNPNMLVVSVAASDASPVEMPLTMLLVPEDWW